MSRFSDLFQEQIFPQEPVQEPVQVPAKVEETIATKTPVSKNSKKKRTR